MTYDVLTEFKGLNFTGNENDRLAIARKLNPNQIEDLLEISGYFALRNHGEITDPHDNVAQILSQKYDAGMQRFETYTKGNDMKGFLDAIAKEVLGHLPADNENLGKESYDKIAGAVTSCNQ